MKLLLLIASFLWGFNIIVMKLMLDYVPALLLSSIRIILSCVVVFLMILKKHCLNERKQLDKKSYLWLLIISFFNVFLNFYLSFIGIHLLSGGNSALINGLQPMVTYIITFFALGIVPNKKALVGIVITIIGFICSIRFNFGNLEIGHLLLFSSLITYCIGNVLIQKKLAKIHQLIINFYNLLFGSLYLFLLVTIKKQWQIKVFLDIPWYLIGLFIIVSVVGYAFIQYVSIKAIKEVGANKTSFYLNLNPVFTYLISLVLLQEKIEPYLMIGLSLIIFSTYFAQKE